MAVFYRLYQDNRENSKYQGKWYARAKMTERTDLTAMAKLIETNVSVKESDVYAVLIELVNVIKNELQASHTVVVDRLGIFRVGLSTAPAESASAFTANANVKGAHIIFQPESRYLSGHGKGQKRTTMMLAGLQVRELPKNNVDTSKKA